LDIPPKTPSLPRKTSRQKQFSNIPGFKPLVKLLPDLPQRQPPLIESDLRHLLEFLCVTDSINGLLLTLQNLPHITAVALQICQSPKDIWIQDIISDAGTAGTALLQNRDFLKDHLPKLDVASNISRERAFHGATENNPLHTTLGHLPKDPKYNEEYYHLCAQVLVAHLRTIHKGQEDTLAKDFVDALDTIRSLALSGSLEGFPESATTMEAYIGQIQAAGGNSKITNYLSKVLNLTKTRTLKELTKLVPPSGFSKVARTRQQLYPPERPARQLPRILDEPPLVDDNNKPSLPGHLFVIAQPMWAFIPQLEFKAIADGLTKTRSMANQLLHYAWDGLNQWDIQTLFRYLFSEEPLSDDQDITVRTQLGLILLTGMSPSRLANMSLSAVTMTPPNPDEFIVNPPTLRLKTLGPVLVSPLNQAALSEACPVQSHIDLPLPEYFWGLISEYLKICPPGTGGRLFNQTAEGIQQACSTALSRLKTQSGTRLTLTKISNFMERKLASLPESDIAGASLTLGKEIYTARTRIHYSSFDSDTLRLLCIKAWAHTAREAGFQPSNNESSPDGPSNYIGTPLRPQLAAVRILFESLRSYIEEKGRGIKGLADLVEFHNAYALYTTLVIAYCTGYRAVNSPFITEDMYDSESGFAVIRDKTSADFYHCRLVWLPDACKIHLKYFEAHAEKIRKMSPHPLPTSNRKDNVFFFLDAEGHRVTVTPSRVKHQLEKFGFHLPANVQRHFIKSELQENGCPVEIIEIFLGHWHLGQEGWTQTSALHPWDFKVELEKHLPRLMNNIGLTPLKGLEKPITSIQLSLHIKTPLEVKEAARPQHHQPDKKTRELLNTHPPAEVWIQKLGRLFKTKFTTGSAPAAFKQQERIVLVTLHKLLPDLYAGKPGTCVSDSQMKLLLRRLQPCPTDQRVHYKRLNFLIDGLEWGKEHLDWQLEIPARPVLVSKGINRVRPSMIRKLKVFRQTEKVFLADLKSPCPNETDLQVGQILLSAVLYGNIHQRKWATGFITGLSNALYQHGEILWVDLWADSLTFQTEDDKWLSQRNPSLYRRWLADPTTQLLIYRWQRITGNNCQPQTDWNLEKIYTRYSQCLDDTFGQPLPRLDELFAAADAWATITTPQFVAAYAAGQITSASLPDPAWMRLLTGKVFSSPPNTSKNTRKESGTQTFDNIQHQKSLLKRLRACLRPLQEEITPQQVGHAEQIRKFLQEQDGHAWDGLKLLGEWAIQLLSDRRSIAENRKKSPEKPSTVDTYLGKFSNQLLEVLGPDNILDLEPDELTSLLAQLVEAIGALRFNESQTPTERKVKAAEEIIDRLNQFLGFLHAFHGLPQIALRLDRNKIQIPPIESVRSNVLSPEEYRRLLDKLGWQNPSKTRLEKMVLVVAILSYRTGMRGMETVGLQIGDIQGTDQVEVLVRPNKIRGLKTRSSKRRIPLSILLPSKELDLVRQWHSFRATELGSTSKSMLFTSGPMDSAPCPYQALFLPLRDALREVTGDPTIVPYVLRHSFFSWLLLRLQLREDVEPGDDCPFIKEPEFSLQNRADLKKFLMENENIGRKALYAGAALMGHADTFTELYSYMHLCDWLCWHFSRHSSCCPPLKAKAITQIVGCHEKNAHKIVRNLEMGVHPLIAQARKKAKDFAELLHPLMGKGSPYVKSPPLPRSKEILPPFDKALHRAFQENTLPKELQWPKSAVELWVFRRLYERIGLLQEQGHETLSLSADLSQAYRQYEKSLVLDDIQEGKRTIDILGHLGIELCVRYHRSRWSDEQKSEKALETWQEQVPGVHIWRGQRLCGRNLENGSIRVTLHETRVENHNIEFDRKLANVFGLLLHVLSSGKTS